MKISRLLALSVCLSIVPNAAQAKLRITDVAPSLVVLDVYDIGLIEKDSKWCGLGSAKGSAPDSQSMAADFAAANVVGFVDRHDTFKDGLCTQSNRSKMGFRTLVRVPLASLPPLKGKFAAYMAFSQVAPSTAKTSFPTLPPTLSWEQKAGVPSERLSVRTLTKLPLCFSTKAPGKAVRVSTNYVDQNHPEMSANVTCSGEPFVPGVIRKVPVIQKAGGYSANITEILESARAAKMAQVWLSIEGPTSPFIAAGWPQVSNGKVAVITGPAIQVVADECAYSTFPSPGGKC